jgi:hypothetical protein
MDSPVAFDRDLARLRLEINRLTVGFVDEAIVVVAKARGFTLRLDRFCPKWKSATLPTADSYRGGSGDRQRLTQAAEAVIASQSRPIRSGTSCSARFCGMTAISAFEMRLAATNTRGRPASSALTVRAA